jgi:cyclophilin family peptidyl-prolyl cis-trans isomerase
MRPSRSAVLLLASLVLAGPLGAQSPTLGRSLPAQSMAAGGPTLTVDLRDYFMLPGVSGPIAQFDTVLGKFNVELLSSDAPASVANFLSYVGDGAFNGTIFHRSLPLNGPGNRISQGGGYFSNQASIPRRAPIPLEYKLPNTRGTLAMARTAELNSATSEWFFNVDDNTNVLGPSNGGGYAVFGRVIGSGMTVVDAIGSLPNYNAGGAFVAIPLRDVQPGQTTIQTQNFIFVNSIVAVPTYPTGTGASVLSFSGSNTATNVATAGLNGSTLVLSAAANGTAIVTVRATDTNGNTADASFAVNVSPGPVFTTQPESRTVNQGNAVVLGAVAAGATGYQWVRNGVDLPGANGAELVLFVQPADVGVYHVRASDGTTTRTSEPAIVALNSTTKVIGAGSEVGPNIVHANGNVYDQVLLTGPAATITADPGQIVRISYVDATDDIVQVEFAGAGALTLSLADASGPAAPVKYNQAGVTYMKGRATIVVGGADGSTNLTIFSVGRATAVNQALFKSEVTYDGMADLALVAILPPSGTFGGLRSANANYSATSGLTGVYAPRVRIGGPLFIGDIAASGTAVPTIVTGNATDVRMTGGDLQQANNLAVRIDGMTRVQQAAGSDSHGNLQPALPLRGRLERSGVDVTSEVGN